MKDDNKKRDTHLNVIPPVNSKQVGLLAIGESLIDVLTTDFISDLSQATTLRIHPGGSPANLCRFVQNIGYTARLVSAVGKDGLGKILLQAIADAGINTDYIQQLDGHATSIIMVARSKGTPDFIAYRDADQYVQPVEEALIEEALIVHTTAFALSKAPAQQTILSTFSTAHSKGIDVSVDWNYAQPIWGIKNNALDIFQHVLSYSPLLKISLDDIIRFREKNLTIEEAKEYLQAISAKVICLTCGAEGVWYKSQYTSWEFLPAQPVEVKDATGAGDAFWAGFLTSWMQRHSLTSCVQQGIAIAAKRLAGEL